MELMEHKGEQLVVLMRTRFGSHLYGTATEGSDTDYKGVFLPSRKMVLLQRVPKSIRFDTKHGHGKNTKDDIDVEYYSLQYFLRLACQGQTIVLDMLHTTKECTEVTSDVWEYLQDHRKDFYTRNLKAFIGYAYQQAAKYGLRSGRLGNVKQVIEVLEKYE